MRERCTELVEGCGDTTQAAKKKALLVGLVQNVDTKVILASSAKNVVKRNQNKKYVLTV